MRNLTWIKEIACAVQYSSQTLLEVNGYPLHVNFKCRDHAPTISWIPLNGTSVGRKKQSWKQIYCLSRVV